MYHSRAPLVLHAESYWRRYISPDISGLGARKELSVIFERYIRWLLLKSSSSTTKKVYASWKNPIPSYKWLDHCSIMVVDYEYSSIAFDSCIWLWSNSTLNILKNHFATDRYRLTPWGMPIFWNFTLVLAVVRFSICFIF